MVSMGYNLNSKVSPCCSTWNCWMLKLQYLFNLSLVARWCVPPRIGRLRVTAREERAWDRGYTAPTFATTGKIGDWMVVTQIRPVSRSDCHWYVGSSTNTATDKLSIWILSWTLNTRSNTDWRVSIDIVGTLFIDLSKAFDSTHHQLLLSKLDGAELAWFQSYFFVL